MFFLISWI